MPPRPARITMELACAGAGALLVAWAARADARWWERHVLQPGYFMSPPELPHAVVRWGTLCAGLLVALLVRPLLGRWSAAGPLASRAADALRVGLALVLALGACELVLRKLDRPELSKVNPRLEARLAEPHPRYGWLYAASRTTAVPLKDKSRVIHYAVNAEHERAASQEVGDDPALPTLLVTGESIAAGHGLEYPDTFAAQLGARLGVQAIDLAENGYGPDQAYLRLVDALPRFPRLVAAVTIFVPVELGRALQDYRPHLELHDGSLTLLPAASGPFAKWRLRNLAVNEVQLYSDAGLSRRLDLVAAIFRETDRAARARGGRALFVMPVFAAPRPGELGRPEEWILRELAARGAPSLLVVDVDPAHLLPFDGHPDRAGATQIADAIERGLAGGAQGQR